MHRVWTWYEANRKPTQIGVGIVVVVGVVGGFIAWRSNAQEAAASEAMSTASLPPIFTGHQSYSADQFLQVANQYPSSLAGMRALLVAAGTLFVAEKYDQAKPLFDRFAREHRESPLMGEALLGSAACLDAMGKKEEALAAYKNLVDHHGGDTVAPQAKFALARMYEEQNKLDLARSYFEDVARDPYSSIGSEAGMRLEELKKKMPPPAPVPSPVAPAPTTTSPVTPGPATPAPAAAASNTAPFKLQER